jgi:CheY-like chemotaxis protein
MRPNAGRRADRSISILLVEDHVDTAVVMSKLLQKTGHAVAVAGTYAGAVEATENSKFDLLICDIVLPDGSGLDLFRQLRLRRPIDGICLSGRGEDEDIEQSKAAGFSVHLLKPVDMIKLESLIQQIASRPRPGV